MDLEDIVVSIHPYYKVLEEDLETFRKLANDLIETTRGDMGCLYYGLSFASNEFFCREAYKNAETLLAHLDNISDLRERLNKIASISRLEIHGPADIEHSNLGWSNVAKYAKELSMEDRVVRACRENLVVWENYLNGIGAAGDAEDVKLVE